MEPLTAANLGPRVSSATSYFRRLSALESNHDSSQDSDLLKSLKQVVQPTGSSEQRVSTLYLGQETSSLDDLGMVQELSWNNTTVVFSTAGMIAKKWSFENEGQNIQWACKSMFEVPGGVAEGPAGSFAAASSNDASPSNPPSSTFSSFALSAQRRQRAVEPRRYLPAVFVFLRNVGKIYVDDGTDYTFHIPFLVRRAWPLRPHGVLVQREISDSEIRESARENMPVLPTLFTLHDPFAEFKVVGLASRIHGGLATKSGIATAISQPALHPPETKTPEDFSLSAGYKPTPLKDIQTEAPPPPPQPEKPPPLLKPPSTDQVIWVTQDTTPWSFTENLIVTLTLPLQSTRPDQPASQEPSPSEQADSSLPPNPMPHRYSHQLHLSLWRYAYFKPREVPDPITPRPKAAVQAEDKISPPAVKTPPSTTPALHHDPDVARRRELQDRADRIAPSSPNDPLQTDKIPNDPFAIPLPRQPLGVSSGSQPTLTSLPGGELPSSWGHPHPERPSLPRKPSLSVTMDRMALGAEDMQTEVGTEEQRHNEGTEAEKNPNMFMNAGHMKMQPSVWLEKVAVISIPFKAMRHPDRISVHLFDSRADSKLERSLLAVHFPTIQLLSIYTLARIPAEDTLRLYPPVHMSVLSATPVVAFRPSILDLLVVKPDNTLGLLTHGIRTVDVKISPEVFNSTSKASSVSHQTENLMAVDEVASTHGDTDSDSSMHSVVDKSKIVAVSEPLHRTATVHFMDGSTSRIKFSYSPGDPLVVQCFWTLSYALSGPRAFALHYSWVAKWYAVGATDVNGEEWRCFEDAFCELLGIPSPYEDDMGADEPTLGSWEALAYSDSQERMEKDLMFMSLKTPLRTRRLSSKPPTGKPQDDAASCLLALHMLGESFKLKSDAIHAYLPRLARLLILLGRAVRPEWADHWARLYPDIPEGWEDPISPDYADARLRPQPPDLFAFLFTRLVEPHGKPTWTSLPHVSHLFKFDPSVQYGRIDPMKDLHRLFNVWECFSDASVPTARKRAESALQTMVRMGMTLEELDRMPHGIAQPIREALRACQSVPSGDWSVKAYQLASRPDLAQMMSGDSSHITSRDSFRQVNKHLDPSISRRTVGELLEEVRVAMSPELASPSGVELDLGDFTDIRFGNDRRLQEVGRMLQSSSPAVVKMLERHDLTEHEVAREQQTTALRVAERTLAMPVGRAMFTFGSVPTVTRDAYQIPKMEFAVRLQPYNALVSVDVTKMNAEAKNWADFHNGTAAGLRLSPSSRMVDSSWITFNKPNELTAQHAGFLFGLGLTGHLRNMMTWHTFSYLTPKHDLTSIGVLLGLSAAHFGTANRRVTKLLAVHTPALLPNPSVDLNVPMLTQASGLVGLGLLYMGTKNRRMAEVALNEISRTQVTSADQTTDHREAYSLSAALSFGMIMLRAGATNSSPADMSMIARLRLFIHGEPVLLGNKTNTSSFDVTLTSVPATLALALMFLKTGREDIADILVVPTTLLELHHLQPSFLLVRTLGRALIMWDKIAATPQWVTDQLPKSALEALEKRMHGKHIDESQELAYFNIVSGACFALGLKYAGTAHEDPYSCLLHFHDLFTRISNQSSGQFDHRIKRAAVRDGLNLISLSLSMVMAGTGEINCLRRFRFAHGQAIQPGRYGVHMATHMAIGMLFLGGGRGTLGTSDCAIACLLAAFYPRFPTLSHENRGHLQALRHLWVLAVEPRCLIGRDVDTKEVVYLPVKVKLKEGEDTRSAQLISPTLFPDINKLLIIRVDTPRYFSFFLDVASNPRHRELLLRSQTLWVKRRTGHLGYGEDPRGSRSIYVRSGASSGDAAILDNPKSSDAKSPSAGEFYQFMSSFSNEAFYVAFVDRFCRSDSTDEQELIFSAFSHAALLECLTLDRAHLLPTYLSVHLARTAPPWSAHTFAVRDLAWLDEFYKNIYDSRFSGKSDNAPMPPLIRRPLLLAAERTVDQRVDELRMDATVLRSVRQYHRGEGLHLSPPQSVEERRTQLCLVRSVAFYLTRTNVPPARVLRQMRSEAQATVAEMQTKMAQVESSTAEWQAAQNAIDRALRGLLWNTGVLFASGILRPWSMRTLEEVISHWTS